MATHIEWTEETWSPVTGCTRISDGCTGCYIERQTPMRIAKRRFDGNHIGATTGVQLHPDRLDKPLRRRKPTMIFVCSMADLFHDDVPDEYIARVFAVLASAPQHTFQVLTKRAARMRSLLSSNDFRVTVSAHMRRTARQFRHLPEPNDPGAVWPLPNVWLGVSVESQQWADIRIPQLIDTPAAIRFISAEPLLGPIDLYGPLDESGTHRPKLTYWLTGRPHWDRKDRIAIGPHLDWVIAGGESGPNARPIHPDWARTLRDQCAQSGVAFLYKQWGEWSPHEAPSWPTGDVWRNPDRHRWVDPDTGESKPFGDFTGTDDLLWSLMHRVGKNTAGRLLDGRTWDQYPAAVNGGRP